VEHDRDFFDKRRDQDEAQRRSRLVDEDKELQLRGPHHVPDSGSEDLLAQRTRQDRTVASAGDRSTSCRCDERYEVFGMLRQILAPALLIALAAVTGEAAPASSHDRGLIDAVKQGDATGLRALLQGGADVNAAEADGTTALHWAAQTGNLPAVTALVRA